MEHLERNSMRFHGSAQIIKSKSDEVNKMIEERKKEVKSKGLKELVEYLYEECIYYSSPW